MGSKRLNKRKGVSGGERRVWRNIQISQRKTRKKERVEIESLPAGGESAEQKNPEKGEEGRTVSSRGSNFCREGASGERRKDKT